MRRKLTDHEVMQMEQAASGCIDGTLAEWPHLNAALVAYGIELPPNTHYMALKRICSIITDQLDPLNIDQPDPLNNYGGEVDWAVIKIGDQVILDTRNKTDGESN